MHVAAVTGLSCRRPASGDPIFQSELPLFLEMTKSLKIWRQRSLLQGGTFYLHHCLKCLPNYYFFFNLLRLQKLWNLFTLFNLYSYSLAYDAKFEILCVSVLFPEWANVSVFCELLSSAFWYRLQPFDGAALLETEHLLCKQIGKT